MGIVNTTCLIKSPVWSRLKTVGLGVHAVLLGNAHRHKIAHVADGISCDFKFHFTLEQAMKFQRECRGITRFSH
jgi:hypothetical protein